MKISVIIPNYNGEKLLEHNLPRICKVLESSGEEIEIIIPDDASKDASLNIIQAFIKSKKTKLSIRVIKNPRNIGFSSNVNSGVQVAS
ncbi:MAG TPA: glycosyltransferase family 2 protein, partial [Candidatus Woesebacteria bacterium]|nr:glycosyltransferase family 2 protein [Candidatus Woesebacteria bacterium]